MASKCIGPITQRDFNRCSSNKTQRPFNEAKRNQSLAENYQQGFGGLTLHPCNSLALRSVSPWLISLMELATVSRPATRPH